MFDIALLFLHLCIILFSLISVQTESVMAQERVKINSNVLRGGVSESPRADLTSGRHTPLPANWRSRNIGKTFTDLWIARYHDPRNMEIRRQLDLVEKELSAKVSANGGRWHVVEYFGPSLWHNDVPDSRYLLNGGVRLYGIGDLDNARRLFEQTLRDDPNNPDAYFNLGALCENAGKNNEARAFYLKARLYGLDSKATRTNVNADIAASTVGKMPVFYEGGLHEEVKKRMYLLTRSLKSTTYTKEGTCSLCRIVRGVIMSGN